MFIMARGLSLVVLFLCATICFGQDDPRRFVFPDTPPNAGQPQARQAFLQIRERMHNASHGQGPLTSEDQEALRVGLTQLAAGSPDDPVTTYALRRRIVLDWQTGRSNAVQAANELMEIGAKHDASERYLTWAMALTIDARDGHFDRFQKGLPSLLPSETPQFGWFVSEYSRYLLKGYVEAGATPEERTSGKPVPEEYRRSVEISTFLETTYFDAIEEYLRQCKSEMGQPERRENLNSSAKKLERAQMALAMKQLTEFLREVLGRRLYLDVSERTTDVLLPRSLQLWESAVELIESDGDGLESAAEHRKEIKTFREGILPHLKELQKDQHLLREFGKVISSQEETIERLDREELARLTAERTNPSSKMSPARTNLVIANVVFVCLVVVAAIYRWRKRSSESHPPNQHNE